VSGRPSVSPDTIAAIATAPGTAGIGVVRVSGAAAKKIAAAVCGRVPEPRRATKVALRAADGELVDHGLALWFPAPRSYTGEPVLELQGHGGPIVLHGVLAACLDAGARLAEPGEFTQRAFLNGKLDLAQAEAVADLIGAATAEAARSALRSLTGEFSTAVNALIDMLTELRALTESMLDFSEEEIDRLHTWEANQRMEALIVALQEVFSRSRRGSLMRTGLNVVLAGRPNVGKSSLMNRLAGEERAIVTSVPGTTRDALREAIQIEGVPLNIVDTAGLHESEDQVERLGMERTWTELKRADIVLILLDASVGETVEDRRITEELPEGVACIRVWNKIDLVGGGAATIVDPGGKIEGVRLSARSGEGLELLHAALLDVVGIERGGETPFLARERHLRALERAQRHLLCAAGQSDRWELFAEELRLAQIALMEIGGDFSADDLLGEIFSRFCIGK